MKNTQTLIRSVYERIRADVLSGQLAPGQKLLIENLREQYQAGGSPVREALNRLSAERLVQHLDQRGFAVAPVSVEGMLELARTRIWVETMALRQSIANRTPAWEEELVLAGYRLSRVPRSISPDVYQENPEWERRHRALHHAFISRCDSSWLLGFCEQLYDQAYRYRQLAVRTAYKSRNVQDEHQLIIDAAVEGRADDAAALLERHYQHTADIILAISRSEETATKREKRKGPADSD